MNYHREILEERDYLRARNEELLKALSDLLMVIETDALVPESVSYMRQARAAIASLNKC